MLQRNFSIDENDNIITHAFNMDICSQDIWINKIMRRIKQWYNFVTDDDLDKDVFEVNDPDFWNNTEDFECKNCDTMILQMRNTVINENEPPNKKRRHS